MPRRKQSKVDPRPNLNMGRLQHAEPHWGDHGSIQREEDDYLRGPERADREEREAYGRPLPAAYRHLLGPAPSLSAGDTTGARAYLSRIEQAVEHGGWTRSEWRRLRSLRSKWKARVSGEDARFKEVGNRRGGLTPCETANVKTRRTIAEMGSKLMAMFKSEGD